MTNASYFADNNIFTQNPFFALSIKILNIYSDALRQNMESLTTSSAKIIQEHTIQAWANAAQSCSKALAENAASSQQQAMARIAKANQAAFETVARDISPFNMQPMAEFAPWFSAAPGNASKFRHAH
jgi:hypothetical protein